MEKNILTLILYWFYNSKPNCFNGFNRLLGLYFLKILEWLVPFP